MTIRQALAYEEGARAHTSIPATVCKTFYPGEVEEFTKVAGRVLSGYGNWKSEKDLHEGSSLQEVSHTVLLSPQDKEDITQECLARWFRKAGYPDKLPMPETGVTEEFLATRKAYFGSMVKWAAKYYCYERGKRAEDCILDTEFGRASLGDARPEQELREAEALTAILDTVPDNIPQGREIAYLLLNRYTTQEIANKLQTSQRTIQRRVEQLRYWLAAGSLDLREPVAKKKVFPVPAPQYQVTYIHMPTYGLRTP